MRSSAAMKVWKSPTCDTTHFICHVTDSICHVNDCICHVTHSICHAILC